MLIRKRQRAHMRGDLVEARYLRNQVNRATAKLKLEFYHTRIEAMHELGIRKLVENIKKINGSKKQQTNQTYRALLITQRVEMLNY